MNKSLHSITLKNERQDSLFYSNSIDLNNNILSKVLKILIVMLLISKVESNSQTIVNKLTLSQIEDYKYALKAGIGSEKANIQAHLSDQLDWIKQNDCVFCPSSTGSSKDCTQSCSLNEQKGITCTKSYCKIEKLNSKQEQSLKQKYSYFITQAKQVQLKVKEQPKNRKITYKTLLVSRMTEKTNEVGRINLFNGRQGFFGDQVLIIKNHGKDLAVYYYQSEDKAQPLYKDIQLVKVGDSVMNISLQTTSDKQEVKNKKQSKAIKDNQQEDQKQVNIFDISKIQIKDMQNYKQEGKNNLKADTNKQQKGNKWMKSISLSKTTAQFSIKTNKLILPPHIHKKLTEEIIANYFNQSITSKQSSLPPKEDQKQEQSKSEDDQDSKYIKEIQEMKKDQRCSFSINILSCPSRQFINLQKLNNITITLVLNNIPIQFPIRSLVESCAQKQCTFLLDISKDKKQVIIGDFILNIFAMHYVSATNQLTLYRLNNQWAKNFLSSEDRKFAYKQVNFIFMLLWFIIKAILFFVKIILVLAVVVLILNCLYNWKQVLYWITQVLSKIGHKNEEMETENKEPKMKRLKNKIDKMSLRIKDRLKTALKKSKRNYSEMFHDKIKQLEEQELTQTTQNRHQSIKLMRVNAHQLADQDTIEDYRSNADDEDEDEDQKILNASKIQAYMDKSIKDRRSIGQILKTKAIKEQKIQKLHPVTQVREKKQNAILQREQIEKQMQKQIKQDKQNENKQKIYQNQLQEQFYEFQNTSFQGF